MYPSFNCYDRLGFLKLCARWIPKILISENEAARMTSLEVLQIFNERGNEMLDQIFTGDGTWVHYDTPETKWQSIDEASISDKIEKTWKTVSQSVVLAQ